MPNDNDQGLWEDDPVPDFEFKNLVARVADLEKDVARLRELVEPDGAGGGDAN